MNPAIISIISLIVTVLFGGGGIVAFLSAHRDIRQLQLERDKFYQQKKEYEDSRKIRLNESESKILSDASLVVEKGSKLLNEQMDSIQKRLDDQESRLHQAEDRENSLLRRIQELEREQRRYRDLVRSIANELLEELQKGNGSVDRGKLMSIVKRFFGEETQDR